MITIIDILFMFVLLPIVILTDSWKRLRRVGWEWTVLGFLAMSTLAALMQDVVGPLLLKDKSSSFIRIFLTRAIILGGVGLFFVIYKFVEEPILKKGRIWRILRIFAAAFILAVMVFSVFQAIKSGDLAQRNVNPFYGWLLIAGVAAFMVMQIGMYVHRDKERIEAYRKQKEEEKKKREAA